MGKVYTDQDQLIIYIATGSDLTDAASVYIQGTEPDGTDMTPSILATIEDVSRGIVSYEVLSTDFTTAGTWILWLIVNYSGGGAAWGEPFSFNVYEPGT